MLYPLKKIALIKHHDLREVGGSLKWDLYPLGLHIDSRKYYEDAIIRQHGLAQGHCCNHPVIVIFIPKRNFSRSIREVEVKTVGKLQKNQVNGKGSRTSHDMKFAIVIELKYHNISQYKTQNKTQMKVRTLEKIPKQ